MLELLTTEQLIWASLIVFIGALVQGSAGVGYSIFSVPFLRIVAPELVPVSVLFAVMTIALAALIRERRDISFNGVGWVIAGRVPGAILGGLLLAALPGRALDISIGVMVLLAVVAMALGWTVPYNRVSQFAAGFASGTTGTATAVGGPPLAMLYRERKGPELRSTLATIFLVGLAINLATLAVQGQVAFFEIQAAGLLIPPTLLGFFVSSSLRQHIDGEPLRVAILVISAVAAISLLSRTLS